jgi:hypothetical protein
MQRVGKQILITFSTLASNIYIYIYIFLFFFSLFSFLLTANRVRKKKKKLLSEVRAGLQVAQPSKTHYTCVSFYRNFHWIHRKNSWRHRTQGSCGTFNSIL